MKPRLKQYTVRYRVESIYTEGRKESNMIVWAKNGVQAEWQVRKLVQRNYPDHHIHTIQNYRFKPTKFGFHSIMMPLFSDQVIASLRDYEYDIRHILLSDISKDIPEKKTTLETILNKTSQSTYAT